MRKAVRGAYRPAWGSQSWLQPPSMRRLPPVKQKNPLQCWTSRFPAPPWPHDTLQPFEFNRCWLWARPTRLRHSILSFLPPHFHSHSRLLAPARFLLDSVVRALPSFSRSQSADRFAIHRSDRWRNAVARTRRLGQEVTLAAFLPGQYPQATLVAFILATLLFHLTPHRALSIN